LFVWFQLRHRQRQFLFVFYFFDLPTDFGFVDFVF